MKKITKRVVVFLLCLVMGLNTVAMDAWADTLQDGSETIMDVNTAEAFDVSGNDYQDVSDNEFPVTDEESDLPENSDEEPVLEADVSDNDISVLDVSDNDVSGNDLTEIDIVDDLSNVFYRELTVSEINAKKNLSKTISGLSMAKSGKDYIANNVYKLVDTEEEALEIAKAYSEATGLEVTLASYDYGVAVFDLAGRTTLKGFDACNNVECVVRVAADTANNLPSVSPNYLYHADYVGDGVNTDKETFSDPFLKTTSNNFQWYHDKINDKFVWNNMSSTQTNNLKTVGVAVIDSGIDYNHSEFSNLTYKNFVAASNEPYDSYGYSDYKSQTSFEAAGGDTCGHGTNVCGIIGNTANSAGGRGVAAGVKIFSLRALNRYGTGASADIASALLYCESNSSSIKVVNMSLGGSWADPEYREAIGRVQNKGILIIAAAGNDNNSIPHYPAFYDGVMAVAALNSDYKRSSFSNYGSWVDIAAPGGEHKGDKSRDRYLNEELLWASGSKESSGGSNLASVGGVYYEGMAGTSQATPVVSAVAALVWAYNTGFTAAQVEARLENTAKSIKTDKPCGVGCVDAAKAVGIDVSAQIVAPTANVASGTTINADTSISLNTSNSDAQIYYTTNGKTPSVTKMSSTGTKLYNGTFKLTGKDKVIVKAVTLRYGQVSPVSTYTYKMDTSYITGVTLVSKNGFTNVAIGKKLTLSATVVPSNAKNKKVKWTSSNTTVATVNSSGVVTGKSAGEVTITATSAGNTAKTKSITITVCPAAKQIVVSNVENPLNLKVGSAGTNISSYVSVYPLNASQDVTYSSSNTKVAKVDKNTGVVTAVKSGTAKITITAADGTGIKSTLNVKCVTPVSSVSVTTANGYPGVTYNKSYKMKAVFNGGNSTPDNKKLKWEVTAGSEYLTKFNADTGAFTVRKSPVVSSTPTIKIKATSLENSSATSTYSIVLYQTMASSNVRYYIGQYISAEVGISGNFTSDLAYVANNYCCKDYTYSSSNKAVIAIDKDGNFASFKKGTATLTATPKDGSGKKISVKIELVNFDQIGVQSSNGINVLYPGKKLSYKAVSNNSLKGYIFALSLDDYSSSSLSLNSTYLSASGMSITAKSNVKNVTPGTQQPVYLYNKYGWSFWGYTYWYYDGPYSCATVELYPAGTSKVNISNGSSATIKPKGEYQIKVNSSPSNACQKYYKFKSSNTKVAKVSDTGVVYGVAPGKATITVTAGDGSGKKATVTINVSNPVTSLSVASKKGSNWVCAGKTLQMVGTTNSNATNKGVTWQITDNISERATIDTKGIVKAPGSVSQIDSIIVRGTSKDNSSYSDVCEVVIAPKVAKVSLKDSSKEYTGSATPYTMSATGGNKSLDIILTDSKSVNLTSKAKSSYDFGMLPVSISSSNTKVVAASLGSDNRLLLTPKAPGKATVKITTTEGSAKSVSIPVVVEQAVTGVTVNYPGGQKAVVAGKTLKFAAAIAPTNASNKSVDWSVTVGNTSYASISTSGVLTVNKVAGINRKTVAVNAKAKDGSGRIGTASIVMVDKPVAKINVTPSTGYEKRATATSLTLSPKAATSYKNSFVYSVVPVDASGDSTTCYNEVSATSSNTAVATASYASNKVTINAVKAGSAVITLKALDGSGKTAKINVKVVNPVTSIAVYSKTGYLDVAGGTKLQLAAVVNEDATNKAVAWDIDSALKKQGFKIDQKGVLTTPAVTSEVGVKVTVTSTDGSSISKSVTVYVYAKQTGITFTSNPAAIATTGSSITVNSKKSYLITIKPKESEGFGSYTVTYSGDAVVTYSTNTDSATVITVYPRKAGDIKIYCAPNDGSGKKFSFTVKAK